MSSPSSSVSRSSSPDAGSSSRSTHGRMASARATSRRRAMPVGSEPAEWSARWPIPTRSKRASAAGPAGSRSARPPVADLDRDLHVLANGEHAERLESLEGPGEPATRAAVGRQTGDVGAAEHDPARRSARRSPLAMLNSVVLPAPLGPMRPSTSPSWRRRRTSSSTRGPAEAHGHVDELERTTGRSVIARLRSRRGGRRGQGRAMPAGCRSGSPVGRARPARNRGTARRGPTPRRPGCGPGRSRRARGAR